MTSIGREAFYGCRELSGITIPDGVTNIGISAFYACYALADVKIPDSVTNISDSAFSFCSGLVSISVGTGNANYKSIDGLLLTKDGKILLKGVNGGDLQIPDGVKDISYQAFYGCKGLAGVTFPDSVTNAESAAAMAATGVSAIMIGRAALSNPDIFNSLKQSNNPNNRTIEQFRKHLDYLLEFRDILARKYPNDHIPSSDAFASVKMHVHLFRYFNGRPGAAELRRRLNTVRTLAEIEDAVRGVLPELV